MDITHRLHMPHIRRTLAVAVAGALAAGALAGPAMAASDGSGAPECRKAGEKPLEYLTVPKAAGDNADFHASGEPQNSIIAI